MHQHRKRESCKCVMQFRLSDKTSIVENQPKVPPTKLQLNCEAI